MTLSSLFRSPADAGPLRLLTLGCVIIVVAALLSLAPVATTGATTDRSSVQPAAHATPSQPPSQPIPRTRNLNGPLRDADGQMPPRAGRPTINQTHPDENRHSLAPATVSARYASGIVLGQQVLIGDAALPWAYQLDPAVVERLDEATIHAAVRQWDDVLGSRWASQFVGHAPGRGSADGHSTIFLKPDCTGLTTANTYLFTDGGLSVERYGTTGTQIREADIGICPRVQDNDTLFRAIRHEVGHVLGLGHLCNPGDDCWVDEMGPGPHECRVMYWQDRPCQTDLTEDDRLAVRTLYPTLRPLSGQRTDDTLARSSFARFDDASAPVAVVMATDASSGVAPSAAAMAGRLGGPFLQATPEPGQCLTGPALIEANRTLARRAELVLVGQWPASCARLAYDWDIDMRIVPADDPVQAARDLTNVAASIAPNGIGEVVLTALDPDNRSMGGDAAAAAVLAGARGIPLFSVQADRVDPVVTRWLEEHQVATATVVGAGLDHQVIPALQRAGLTIRRVAGVDRVHTGIAVATLSHKLGATGAVLTSADPSMAALAAATVAVHDDAALLLSPPTEDPLITAWLGVAQPTHGWLVAQAGYPSQMYAPYGAWVGSG